MSGRGSLGGSGSNDPAAIDQAGHQSLFNAILKSIPIGLLLTDPNGIIICASASAVRLFDRADELALLGTRLEEHIRDPAGRRGASRQRPLGLGRVMNAVLPGGRTVPVEVIVAEAGGAGRDLYVVFLRDLTEQSTFEDELRKLQTLRQLGELSAGVAHDFNNLLTVIIGNLQLIADRIEGADGVAVAEALEAATIGKHLVDRLLAFGRKQTLVPREADVVMLVTDFAELLRRTLGEAINLVVGVKGHVGPALVDSSQLQSALLNLSLNARDAMPGGGQLRIDIEELDLDRDDATLYPDLQPGPYVCVSVSDNGCGMPPDVRERAFEPFFTTKSARSGTGLGLSMVYGFVRQSGGRVQIYSEVGRGTIVRLYLPAAEAGAAAFAQHHAPAGHGETVLVVEDDARIRRVASAMLRGLGYEVLDAVDATAALHLAKATPNIDVLFTDVALGPGMDGFGLADRLRTSRPALPVLLTSGFAGPEATARERVPGASWIRKPYTRRELAEAIADLLGTDRIDIHQSSTPPAR